MNVRTASVADAAMSATISDKQPSNAVDAAQSPACHVPPAEFRPRDRGKVLHLRLDSVTLAESDFVIVFTMCGRAAWGWHREPFEAASLALSRQPHDGTHLSCA